MNSMIRRTAVLTFVLLPVASFAAAQDTLASARQLYGSAAYDEALTVLDRLKATPPPAQSDALAVDQYRAFCLMALGRQADAVSAIEAVVAANPSFVPNEADVSPRVVAAFRDARRRLLPGVAQQRYLAAKTAYDRKDFVSALAGFDETMRIMAMEDLAEVREQPPLSDLRTLATGFRELARAAIPPPPKVEAEAKPAPPPPPPPKPFYTLGDAGVVPPVAVKQTAPRWPANMLPGFVSKGRRGVLEVLITEQGTVSSVIVRQPISPLYDDMLVKEARGWTYRPATKDNVPVKFMKLIEIALQ